MLVMTFNPEERQAGDVLAAGRLVSAWAQELSRTAYTPHSRADLETLLDGLVARLLGAAEPEDPHAARAIGAELVDAGLVADVVTPATSLALSAHLPELVRRSGHPSAEQTAARLQAEVLNGYVIALRRRLLDEQEGLHRAEVGARRQAQQAMLASEARFRAVFTDAGVGIGIADLDGRIVDANEAFASMLGYSVEEFCRLNVSDLADGDDAPGMWQMYRDMVDGVRDSANVQKGYRHRDGHLVWTELSASLIRGGDDETPRYTVVVVHDVTAKRELQEQLRYQAMHDPLTGLANRSLFWDRLSAMFEGPGDRVGLCYLDLDHFKLVNDSIGHDVGDELLVITAERLQSAVRSRGHLAARIGGDEFVILVENPPPGELHRLADDVLAQIAQPARVLGHDLRVSASLGLVEVETTRTTPTEIMKAADVTLYQAKAAGRGRWVRYDPDRAALATDRAAVTASILPGLTPQDLVIVYQPIVDLGLGRIRGVEALVRWRHPGLGVLEPDQFIALAEQTGAVISLGRHVLAETCRRVARWNRGHPGRPLLASVNLAVRQIQEPQMVQDVFDILADTGLPGQMLQLELTERALLNPQGRPVEALAELAARGVRIAIDDFGTGYSNLGYLPRLPLTTLKLAGTLVNEVAGLARRQLFLTRLVGLAHGLDLHVTAEGVETADQVDVLRASGCDTAQGWWFGHPQPWEELEQRHLAAAPA